MNNEKIGLFTISFEFQIFSFLATVALLCGLFYIPLHRFTPREKFPGSVASLENIKQRVHPQAVVQTGLYVRSFSEFDMVKGNFTWEGTVWFDYDPQQVPLSVLEQFSCEHGEIIKRSPVKITPWDGKHRAQWDIQVRMRELLDHHDFPLDDHRLIFEIGNHTASERGIVFDSSPDYFGYGQFFLSGWEIVGKNVSYNLMTEFLPNHGDSSTHYYQSVMFGMNCMRKDIRHLASILIPLLVILFFTMYCFSLNTNDVYDDKGRTTPHTQTLMSLVLFGVSTLVSYRFIIESLSPDTSYFMFSDYLFFFFLFMVMCIFVLVAQTHPFSVREKKIIMLSVYGAVVLLCGLLFVL